MRHIAVIRHMPRIVCHDSAHASGYSNRMSMLRWRNYTGISQLAKDVPSGFPAVYVLRGDRVESVHSIAACVAAADRSIAYEAGNIDAPVYLRSCAKPIIAAAVLLAGAKEHFDL